MRASRVLRGLVMTVAALLGAPLAANQDSIYVRNPFEEQVDAIERDGFEHVNDALERLRALQQQYAPSPNAQRVLLQAMGTVLAHSGATEQATAVAEQLAALAPTDPSGHTLAASQLVRAELAWRLGQPDTAAEQAQSALPVLLAHCPNRSLKEPTPRNTTGCDYRSAWRALGLLERQATRLGLEAAATQHAQAALALAEWAGDPWRQSSSLAVQALNAQGQGDRAQAQQLIARAHRAAAQTSDRVQQALIGVSDGRITSLQGNLPLALQRLERAHALVARANAPRNEAIILNNISDLHARMGHPADALRSAEQALPLTRQNKDANLEATVLGNLAVAQVQLGHSAAGQQRLSQALDIWEGRGDTRRQVAALVEVGEALAAAGEARAALALYHRERKLSGVLATAQRDKALEKLRASNDAAARQRDIELLERDNALKTEALANDELRQRIWALLAAAMLLGVGSVVALHQRVRRANARLATNQAHLQAQSERDPLTNLANRRHFQAVMARLEDQPGGFEGALLLVDIDHFKQVNDVHGHAAGDQILVEVARRLNGAVRSDDLVVRWGGEEFLILSPGAAAEQAEHMAARALRSIGGTPMDAGAAALQVTTSVGYARFPLRPNDTRMPWTQAIKLVDLALYTAKKQGRNRAMGITATNAETPEALQAIEEDFENACDAGHVTLLQTPGPSTETP